MFKGTEAAYQQITPAGADVIKAYVGYIIESMNALERREPGSAKSLRSFLLSTWLPLKQYAPEMIGAFSELEALSRSAGQSSVLPVAGGEDTGKVSYERRVKNALESRQPEELALAINFALSQRDFAAARKMTDLLPDGERKTKFTEEVNTREAISLAAKGDLLGAQRLAEQLTLASSILGVYPVLLDKCVALKDSAGAPALAYQALKQLKRAGDEKSVPLSLSRLAKTLSSINESLALEMLDETVLAANRSGEDTGQGRTGIEADIFRILAAKNETRTRQAAETLKDPLRHIVALAVISQWKAEELSKTSKTRP
jgi:hypothetical protein